MQTKLQRIATRRNWLLNFTLQKLHLGYQPDLKLAKDTMELVYEINDKLEVLKRRVDRDWKNQRDIVRAQIKEELARPKIPF